MDDLAAGLRREQAITALLPLFFVSGATALVYQTLWNRDLHLVFGTSTFAIATVLSAFMAGLALGGAVMARYADRAPRPLAMYGGLEVVIGLYALAFPWIVDVARSVYLSTWHALEPGPVLFGLLQFSIVGVTLLLPTAAMGATLPLLARFATSRLGAAGDRIGTLYSVNTAGAVFGTWFAGFVLLPAAGLWLTTICAAMANLALGAAAIGLDVWAGADRARVEVKDDLERPFTPNLGPVALALGLAGFSSLVYEVAWTRLLGLMVGASVYAFSVMLLAFLVGIAIGGKIGGPLADRALGKVGPHGVLWVLGGVECGVAVMSYGLMYVFPELPFWYVWTFDLLGAKDSPTMMWVTSLVVSGVVMTPPAVLMGIAFPVAVRAVVGDSDALGGPVGNVYAANTVGGMVGAFAAGFVLLPNVGVQTTIFVAAMVNLLAAGAALYAARDAEPSEAWLAGPGSMVVATFAFLLLPPPWDPLLMTSGMYHYVTEFSDHSRAGILEYSIELYDLVYYEEGLSTVVTVARNKESGNMWLANNGKVDASTTTDMPTQVLCSLLPMQFAQTTDEVLVIGLASGITAGAVTQLEGLGRLDIVELEPAIERAAREFGSWNNYVLDDPRVHLLANDGRNHLLLTPEQSYDVIVSEPSNPWITGVSNLFTREFWEMGKKRLKPGGVWSQWVQMYGMDDNDLKSLLHTFATVYPHVILYATIEDADLVLVGSDAPLVPDIDKAKWLFAQRNVRHQLQEVDITDPYAIVSMYQMNRDEILAATEGSPMNTDDNMRIEYNAPLNLHRDTHDENMVFMLRNARLPTAAIRDAEEWAHLAEAYDARGDSTRAMVSWQKAIAASTDEFQAAAYRESLQDVVLRVRRKAEEQEEEDEQ
ncbi:MAG: fused MFS/spermidine synthase [Alphaproteobacteria bacterium]|nr:fused MFS/spermidine synthase [Alphaproteobacteria bacterium]